MSGKLLMFAKLSLKSFVYDLVETFMFPSDKVKEILEKYKVERVETFHVLTDVDSTSLKFIFLSDPYRKISEKTYSIIIFEVIIASKTY